MVPNYFRDILLPLLGNNKNLIQWLMDQSLLTSHVTCDICTSKMSLIACKKRIDSFVW
jgi:hypothetical protein